MYRVTIYYPDGSEDSEEFDTKHEAKDYAEDCVAGYRQGAEDLYLRDGCDDDDWEDIEYEIEKI